jgi:aspartokinase/homoserine dehydrogenase 1
MSWVVHKFGGTSVADAACIRRVAELVAARAERNLAIVVSAMRGVTDQLLGIVEHAERGADWTEALGAARGRYAQAATELLTAKSAAAESAQVDAELREITRVLEAVSKARAATIRGRDLVAGFGEVWSARLLTRVLEATPAVRVPVRFVDAREVVVVDWTEMGPVVVWEESRERCEKLIGRGFKGIAVVTGFIASTRDGLPTTLGRNGSDYSASIFGALLDAAEVEIWTDVDGVMSADPRRVPEAKVIDAMSYNEAMELAYFGAKVIHPQTMAPAVTHDIPLRIRNTFNPEHQGTVIGARLSQPDLIVKGVSAVDGMAVLNLEGAGMIGVPGTADRLFGALRDAGISVTLISQGGSEHSICFAVREDAAEEAKRVVERAFGVELEQGLVQRVDLTPGCAILAVVGDGMAGLPGSAGRFFRTLGNAGINVRAIAQGASERNISAVIASQDTTRALRAVHSSFYLSAKTVSIGIVGPGSVGAVFVDQLAAASRGLRERFDLDLRIRGIANSRQMCLSGARIDLANWRAQVEAGEPLSLDRFTEHVQTDYLPHAVIIDCTASQEVANRYSAWLARGIHVITPNKRAHSGPVAYYHELKRVAREANTHFLYEATVGAGLPVISTLRDLVDTGDDIDNITGIFSGTLAYLFNVFDGKKPFSGIVREARTRGYTEPDPRDDLSGLDVARKAVILAREAGLDLELADLEVESLAPPALAKASVDEFLERLPDFDAPMAERVARARREHKVLRYVAEVDVRRRAARVRLQEFGPEHPFANISLTDNIVQFVTRRYSANPLIVRGPGAGPEVTAGGMFADLLRLCRMLGGSD